eukprot:4197037-Prymnesium_polylepis.1
MKKAGKKAQGHVPKTHKVSEATPLTRRKGGVKLGAMSKKSIRKREKRAEKVRPRGCARVDADSRRAMAACNPFAFEPSARVGSVERTAPCSQLANGKLDTMEE